MHTEFNSIALQFIFYSKHKRTFMFWINVRKSCKSLFGRSFALALSLSLSLDSDSHSNAHFFHSVVDCSITSVSVCCGKCQKLAFIWFFTSGTIFPNFHILSDDGIWFWLFDSNENERTEERERERGKDANYELWYQVIWIELDEVCMSERERAKEKMIQKANLVERSYFFVRIFIATQTLGIYLNRARIANIDHTICNKEICGCECECVCVHVAYVVSFHFIWKYEDALQVHSTMAFCIISMRLIVTYYLIHIYTECRTISGRRNRSDGTHTEREKESTCLSNGKKSGEHKQHPTENSDLRTEQSEESITIDVFSPVCSCVCVCW